jgi:hypothetical protein
MIENFSRFDGVILIGGYIVLLCTSGKVLNFILSKTAGKDMIQKINKDTRDTGFIVGKCENLLILTFMVLDAYTALALIFAAKAVVRREDMSKSSLYFLAGTMINITYSIMFGLAIKILIKFI